MVPEAREELWEDGKGAEQQDWTMAELDYNRWGLNITFATT